MLTDYDRNSYRSTNKLGSEKLNNKNRNIVISPEVTRSPFSIPGSPKKISIEGINKITDIYFLNRLEYEYDEFLEKRYQILMLLGYIDEIFEIRDAIMFQLNTVKRQQRRYFGIL